MSTWTSRPFAIFLMLTLAACGGGGGGIGSSGSVAPSDTMVTSDRIVIAGPDGFCVDPTATRNRDDTGFVLLGNCAAISNSRRAGQPSVPAVLTAAISAPGDTDQIVDNIYDLDDFFRSDDGLRLLSRNQDMASVTVLDSAIEGDVFFLRATDSSEGPIDGVQDSYWRAYLDLGNRIATLSVLGMEDRALSEQQSLATLRDFVRTVRSANTGPQPVRAAQPLPAQTNPVPENTGPLWDVGFFRRILG